MLVHRPADLVVLIRARRHELGMTQTALAEAIGASRRWVVKLESSAGESAELGLVLKALDVLQVDVSCALRGLEPLSEQPDAVDLDALLEDMKDDA